MFGTFVYPDLVGKITHVMLQMTNYFLDMFINRHSLRAKVEEGAAKIQSSQSSSKDVEQGQVYQPLTLLKLAVAHLPLPEKNRKFAEYMHAIPVLQHCQNMHTSLAQRPRMKILKVKSDASIHGVAASLQNQILPQHYEHIVYQRQLAKLPILGSEQRLCYSISKYLDTNRR